MADPRRHRNRYRVPSQAGEPKRALTDPDPLARGNGDLHVCPECSSEMVQPEQWAPVDMRRWRVVLRCPECHWQDAGVFPQHVLDRFDAKLDEGAAALMADLDTLERANMEEHADKFITALTSNQILPEDF